MTDLHFPRSELASRIADQLVGATLLDDARNGLFLAQARRTGKSWFLQSDLKPSLEAKGWIVLYVDLWSAIKVDPGRLISNVIQEAFESHLGWVVKATKKLGIEKLGIPGIATVETASPLDFSTLTLADALRELHTRSAKKIALLIDEAQHALTTEEGEASMFALKSARDQMNAGVDPSLLLVMTGSHQDKLMRLTNSPAAPFWGSRVVLLEPLGATFIDWWADRWELDLPRLKPLDRTLLHRAFTDLGHRPEFFLTALREAIRNRFANASEPADGDLGADVSTDVLALAAQQKRNDREGFAAAYLQFDPLEQAILWRLLEHRTQFRPFDSPSMAFYKERLSKTTTAATVQRKLEGLREKTPPLLWKTHRGEYAPYDQSLQDWYNFEKNRGSWPPTPTETTS